MGCGSAALGISFGGSAGAEAALGLVTLPAKGFPDENDGERLVLSLKASDQLKPSPMNSQSLFDSF